MLIPVTSNLSTGVAGGQAVIGGTGATDILSLKVQPERNLNRTCHSALVWQQRGDHCLDNP